MKPIPKAWCSFVHQNIEACFNAYDVIITRAQMVQCILKKEEINVGQTIAQNIQLIANDDKTTLAHASIITYA